MRGSPRPAARPSIATAPALLRVETLYLGTTLPWGVTADGQSVVSLRDGTLTPLALITKGWPAPLPRLRLSAVTPGRTAGGYLLQQDGTPYEVLFGVAPNYGGAWPIPPEFRRAFGAHFMVTMVDAQGEQTMMDPEFTQPPGWPVRVILGPP